MLVSDLFVCDLDRLIFHSGRWVGHSHYGRLIADDIFRMPTNILSLMLIQAILMLSSGQDRITTIVALWISLMFQNGSKISSIARIAREQDGLMVCKSKLVSCLC